MDGMDWGRTDRMGEMGMGVRIHPRVGCGVWREVGEERELWVGLRKELGIGMGMQIRKWMQKMEEGLEGELGMG